MSLKRAWGFFISSVAILGVLIVGLDIALEFLVAPDKVAAVCAQQLSKRLGRQVRIKAAGIGLWNGLWMEDVAVSEAPDFLAGDFLQAGRVSIRPRFAAMVLGRISAEEAVVSDVKLHVIRRSDGSFNFSDLFSAVPSAFKALPVDVRQTRVRRGEALYTDPAATLNLLISDIDIWIDAAVAHDNIDSRTDFKVQGVLAGKSLETEVSWSARSQLKDFKWTASSGKLTLTGVRHPHFKTDLLRAQWDLSVPPGTVLDSGPETAGGFTPFLTSAQGVMRLEGSSGRLENPAALAQESRWAGLLLYPLDVLAKFRGLGFSDLGDISYSEMRGDYSFQAGSVNIAPFYIRGPAVSLNAEGVIQLRRRSVGLKANVSLGKTSVGVTIQGPLDNPTITPSISFKRKRGAMDTIEQKIRAAENR